MSKTHYRCPYCNLPLAATDTAKDNEALWCADCTLRVEYFDALTTYEESSHNDHLVHSLTD